MVKNISKKSDLRVLGNMNCFIECIEGVLWITYVGSDDILLTSGESITLTREGNIIIQSLVDSSYTVEPARSLHFLAG